MTMTTLSSAVPHGVLLAQSSFRSVMNALARPGSVQRLTTAVDAPAPIMPGTAAIVVSLFDHDTPVWLDPSLADDLKIGQWLRFHTGAPVIADPSTAGFAVVAAGRMLPPLERLALGTNEYPDRSTTLILQVDSLVEGRRFILRGPGINGTAQLTVNADPADLFERIAINEALFPRGIDLLMVSGDSVAAIPRTTRIEAIGG